MVGHRLHVSKHIFKIKIDNYSSKKPDVHGVLVWQPVSSHGHSVHAATEHNRVPTSAGAQTGGLPWD